MNLDFYKGKKILITGHTGFKGSWMCKALINAGAEVTGYALAAPTEPSLFDMLGLASQMNSVEGDIRDLEHLLSVFESVKPEIVIHMAAQPIVRDSYKDPVYTYETNVMGTVNICEAVRRTPSVRSFVNVTTDKVYLNKEWQWGYRENEELNGFDPYSNSKSCSELVTSSYKNSFFTDEYYQANYGVEGPAVSTCRAGNVIGGGDFANDRIIPDCIRAVSAGQEIVVRNPYSTRPYEHVLEPVMAYLMVAEAQYKDKSFASSYNVGPNDSDCWTTGELVQLFCDKWNGAVDQRASAAGAGNAAATLNKASWVNKHDGGPHEANFLKLDCSKLKSTFGWSPVWNVETTMEKIVEWSVAYLTGGDVGAVMDKQIGEFLA
ncbi:CDP-glucose 4,6-dehydratase [Pseudobutyrivibrio sp. NOR37]|uniref:CDP-glucose 4,6-dehydratase n=1 Tax=Pseudobutyrivibrio xylanivorans TaxID=185007 RepID=A0A6M0LKG0_PSEXY|nr:MULTISPECIES: CDP-glucose 4,6-dehydratase [Pseudobutyrivibrio]NEX02327.1 CDP-glucose 4,6-dehydratase [Pseudobutyrivibrio xylanivorans]SFR78173.1 CDP-glucose 4,6-dehydratase [Pseudobutyrivibrio sp. NOR37]